MFAECTLKFAPTASASCAAPITTTFAVSLTIFYNFAQPDSPVFACATGKLRGRQILHPKDAESLLDYDFALLRVEGDNDYEARHPLA